MAVNDTQMTVEIGATVANLERELRRGERAIAQFGADVDRRLGSIDSRFESLGAAFSRLRSFVAPLAAAIGGISIAGLARDALQLADELEDTAGQLQISTDALQGYRYAAEQTGVESGALETSIARLNAKIGDAVSGEKAATASFDRLGISFRNADGSARSAQDVLGSLADRIASLPDPAQRAAAAAELLGEKAGPRLVSLLSGGAAELGNWLDRARTAGQVMSEETIKRLAAAETALKSFQNWLKIAAGETIGFFAKLSTEFQNSDFNVGQVSNQFEARIAALQALADDAREEAEATQKMFDLSMKGGEYSPEAIEQGKKNIEELKAAADAAAAEVAAVRREYEAFLNVFRPGKPRDDRAPPGSNVPVATFTPLPPPGGGGTDAQTAQVRELTSAMDELFRSQQQSLDLAREDGRARAELAAVFQLQASAQRDFAAGLRESEFASPEEIERVRMLAGATFDLQSAQRGVAASSQETANVVSELGVGFQQMGAQAINSLWGIVNGATTARGAVASLLQSLSQLLWQAALNFGSTGGGAGFAGFLGSLFGMGGSSGIPSAIAGMARFGGARAGGGRVTPGRGYVVGEKRPEWFEPDVPGTIVPQVPDYAGMLSDVSLAGAGTTIHIGSVTTSIKFEGTISDRASADAAVQAMGEKATAAIEQAIDRRITYNLRDRGAMRRQFV